MPYVLFIFLNILLIQLPFSNEEGCTYYTGPSTTAITDDNYLTSSSEEVNMQKCFALSDANTKCCYKKSGDKQTCEKEVQDDYSQDCPEDSLTITNNCGLALFYKPVIKEICTEISLLTGYCCFVKTVNHGTVCLSQNEIDKDNKDEITDYMKDYFKNKYNLPAEEIVSVQCEGSLLKFYEFLMPLLLIIFL